MFTLKIVKGSEHAEGVQAERVLPEPLGRFSVGRDPANAWPIPDRTLAISGRHFELLGAGQRVLLRDLSTNGTFVNGQPGRLAREHVLRDGDRIEMGPYVIEVQGSGLHAGTPEDVVTQLVPPSIPLPRTPSVEDTAPLRGGDPAAMLAAGFGAAPVREGLTEILRAAAPVDAGDVDVTRIRVAPKAAAAPASAPAAAPRASAVPAAPVTPVVPAAPADPVLAALAQGLGLPASALAGRSPAEAAAQVAALAAAAVAVLREAAPPGDALGATPSTEAALQALLTLGSGAPALLQHCGRALRAAPGRPA